MQETEKQIPNLGIESIKNDQELIQLPDGTLPWIDGEIDIPTASIELESGDSIRYGSAVGLHSGIEKLAKKVSPEQSQSAELGLFKSIPAILEGSSLPPNIDRVPSYVGLDTSIPIFKVAKQGRNAARLYFTIIQDDNSGPHVLKLGISPHDKQIALQNIMNGKKGSRQKHDG